MVICIDLGIINKFDPTFISNINNNIIHNFLQLLVDIASIIRKNAHIQSRKTEKDTEFVHPIRLSTMSGGDAKYNFFSLFSDT